ncbi:MAG: LysR family transcriptional regulator [Bdellovibrionales bacterium]
MITFPSGNLQHLFYFHVVATEGSIKLAAKKLNLTQPAISIRIKLLEESLNIKLFDRQFRKLRLSSSGQSLLEYTHKIFSLTQEALFSLKPQSKPADFFRAGYVPSVSKALLHDILKPICRKNLILQVWHGTYQDLHEQLEHKRLDLMIVDTEPKHKKNWNVKEVAQRKLFFVGAPRFRSLKNNFPKSLNDVPFFTFSESNMLRFQVERFFANHHIEPNVIGEIDDISLLLSFLFDGMAVGVVSDRAAREFLNKNLLVKLGEIKGVISRLWVVERNKEV